MASWLTAWLAYLHTVFVCVRYVCVFPCVYVCAFVGTTISLLSINSLMKCHYNYPTFMYYGIGSAGLPFYLP